jgi:hypothetical protein
VLHVGGEHRVAVVETRRVPQLEGHRQPVGRGTHVFSQQTVGSAVFVQRAGQQRIEHQVGQVGRRAAAQCEGVVFVEGGQAQVAYQAQLATLGRGRVDVVEMGEAIGILELAPQRISVSGPTEWAPEHQQRGQGHQDESLAGAGVRKVHATILLDFSLETETWVFSLARNC